VRILVIGSGAREHALCWKIAQSPRCTKLFCAPGNAGTAQVAELAPIKAEDIGGLVQFARAHAIDLTVVGPEAALSRGVADAFQREGLRIFGPSRLAAEIESSKTFAKRLMKKHGIPTARFEEFSNAQEALEYVQGVAPPVWIKADGLAAGKGAVVARSKDEAERAVRAMMLEKAFGDAGRRIIVEESMEGQEATLMAFVAGTEFLAMPPAQDHKRVFDDDRGPNTGGMGCYSPVPAVTPEIQRQAADRIIGPTLKALAEEGRPYYGVLYAELMLTAEGPKVIEFNARFGDPEAQAIVPRLETDLVDLIEACLDGGLGKARASWSPQKSVCVVMASGGYPGDYETGKAIHGLERAARLPETVVFHAGTRQTSNGAVTAGGRVLGVTALGSTFREAMDRAYAGVREIEFEGAHYRRDIGRRAVDQEGQG